MTVIRDNGMTPDGMDSFEDDVIDGNDIMGGLSSVAHDEVPDDVVIRDIAHRDTFPTSVGFILHSWTPGITMIPRSVWRRDYGTV